MDRAPLAEAAVNGAVLASRMTERELQRNVAELCGQLGLFHYHTHDSRRCEPGYPDCTIVGPGGIIWRELKSAAGALRPEQRRWGSRISAAGGDWSVWRPADWYSGLIRRQLLALTLPV